MLGRIIRSSQETNKWLDDSLGVDSNISNSNIHYRSFSSSEPQVGLFKVQKQIKKNKTNQPSARSGKKGGYKHGKNFRAFHVHQKGHGNKHQSGHGKRSFHKASRHRRNHVFLESTVMSKEPFEYSQMNLYYDRHAAPKQNENAALLQNTTRTLPPYKQLTPAYKSPPPTPSPLSPYYQPRFDASKPLSIDTRVAGHSIQSQNAYSYSPTYRPHVFSNSKETAYYRSPSSPLYAPITGSITQTYIPSNPSITFDEAGMSPAYGSTNTNHNFYNNCTIMNNNDMNNNDDTIFMTNTQKNKEVIDIPIEACEALKSKNRILSTKNHLKKALTNTIRKEKIKNMLLNTLSCKTIDRNLVKLNNDVNRTCVEYDPEHPQYNHLVSHDCSKQGMQYDPEHPGYSSG